MICCFASTCNVAECSKCFVQHGALARYICDEINDWILRKSSNFLNACVSDCSCALVGPSFRWSESAIFGEDMFGSAMGEAESSFKLMRGRFGGISTIFDSNGGLFDSRVAPNHNAYGVVAARFNFQVWHPDSCSHHLLLLLGAVQRSTLKVLNAGKLCS